MGELAPNLGQPAALGDAPELVRTVLLQATPGLALREPPRPSRQMA